MSLPEDDRGFEMVLRSGDSRLCHRYSKIDLDLLFSGVCPWLWRAESNILQIGFLSDADATSSCPVCKIWSLCRRGDDTRVYYLNQGPAQPELETGLAVEDVDSTPTYVVNNALPNIGDDVYLKLCRPDSRSNSAISVIGRSGLVDFNRVRSWLEDCCQNHSECGRLQSFQEEHLLGNLIDCDTQKICKASPHSKYAALSYVWGTKQETSNDIECAPLVVQDAMHVTKQAGLRYLWVDRFCITKSDSSRRMAEIRKMDIIFEQAEITIISLGDDPTDGLPGVSIAPRKPQARLALEKGVVRSSMRNPHRLIRESKWWTRAWTLQEAVLSRRRLFFTAEKAYFECHCMHQDEALEYNPPEAHGKRHTFSDLFGREKIIRGPWGDNVINYSLDRSMEDLDDLLMVYRARQMTYASDAISAVLGILERYTKDSQTLKHYYGLPMQVEDDRTLNSAFTAALAWRIMRPIRRCSFPSWSWAGWIGQCGEDHEFAAEFSLVQIKLERLNGVLQTLAEFKQDGGFSLPVQQLSPYIWLHGFHAKIEFLDMSRTVYDAFDVAITWVDKEQERRQYRDRIPAAYLPRVEDMILYQGWEVILLGTVERGALERGSSTVLVVGEVSGHRERVCRTALDTHWSESEETKHLALPNMRKGYWEEIMWTRRWSRLR